MQRKRKKYSVRISNLREPPLLHPVPDRLLENVGSDLFHCSGSQFLLSESNYGDPYIMCRIITSTVANWIAANRNIKQPHCSLLKELSRHANSLYLTDKETAWLACRRESGCREDMGAIRVSEKNISNPDLFLVHIRYLRKRNDV